MKRPVILFHGIEDILCQNLKRRLVHHEFSVIESTEQSDPSKQILIDCPELVIVSSYRKAFEKKLRKSKGSGN